MPSVPQSQDGTNHSGSSKAMRNSETASSPAQDHSKQHWGLNSALTEEVSPVQHKVCAESYHHSWQLPHMLVFRLGCGYNACPSAIFSQSTAILIVFLFCEIGIIYSTILCTYIRSYSVFGIFSHKLLEHGVTVEQTSGGGACYQ